MTKILLTCFFAALFFANAQVPGPLPTPFSGFTQGPTNPIFCTPGRSPLHLNTTDNRLKRCSAVDIWTNLIDEASLPASLPGSVLAYGADPTGTADSSPAFAAAHAALPAQGGVINIPPGTYTFGSSITITKPSVCLEGQGWSITNTAMPTVMKASGAFPIIIFKGSAPCLRRVQMQGTSASGSIGIRLDNPVHDPAIEDVFFDTFGDQAILDNGGMGGRYSHIFIQNSLLVRTGRSTYVGGIQLAAAATDRVLDDVVSTASVTGSGNYGSGYIAGIVDYGTADVLTNSFGHLSQAGIVLAGSQTRATNNRADLNQGSGFVLSGAALIVTANHGFRNGQSATNTYPDFAVSGTGIVLTANKSDSLLGTDSAFPNYNFYDTGSSGGAPNLYTANTGRAAATGVYSFAGNPSTCWTGFNESTWRWDTSCATSTSRMFLNSSSAPANNRMFDWIGNTDGSTYSQLVARLTNDAGSSAGNWMMLGRSANTPSYLVFYEPIVFGGSQAGDYLMGNGSCTIYLKTNTSVALRCKGTDGTVREGTLAIN